MDVKRSRTSKIGNSPFHNENIPFRFGLTCFIALLFRVSALFGRYEPETDIPCKSAARFR